MAGILRDEDSGICFRDLHGFCSTGSQVSWLPIAGAVRHFFTGASDPLFTAYKEFAFASAPKEESALGTRELWATWRDLALRGLAPSAALREAVAGIERSGLERLDQSDRSVSAGEGGASDTSFEELVALELQAVVRLRAGGRGEGRME
jgi:secernin